MLAYNNPMDEEKNRDQERVEEQAPEPPADPVAKTETEPQPELFTRLPLSDKDKWRPGGGLNRLPVYGCVVGVILLIAALILGISLLRRTVWMTMDRGSQQVVQSLPLNLDPAERLRTTRNLSRFRTVLESSSDPYPLMGEFLKRVRASFDDGKFTAEEVEELNLFLEKQIADSGIPLLQLGRIIRNSEFGIRNESPPSPGFRSVSERLRVCALTHRLAGVEAPSYISSRVGSVGGGFNPRGWVGVAHSSFLISNS
jgi:hypothetical protein